MPDPLLERPPKYTVLARHQAQVGRPANEVFERLARQVREIAGADARFAVDPASRLVVAQGQWWYRGEYRVVPEASGCTVSYEVLNVAQIQHWMGRITGRKVVADSGKALADLLATIS